MKRKGGKQGYQRFRRLIYQRRFDLTKLIAKIN
jgi:hypothetical protein